MKAPLRFDPRIVLMEKTDIFEVGKDQLIQIPEEINTILADVSFVSLAKVLRHAKIALAGSNTDFLVMLKPQFEAYSERSIRELTRNM